MVEHLKRISKAIGAAIGAGVGSYGAEQLLDGSVIGDDWGVVATAALLAFVTAFFAPKNTEA